MCAAIVFAHACKLGCEGIVSKRLGSVILYTASFCRFFKFVARVGGATTCPNASRPLRVR
jgi:hypothetical protein